MFSQRKKLNSGQKEAVKQFKDFASVSHQVAQEWLRKHDWHVQEAMDDFFGSTGGAPSSGTDTDTAQLNQVFDHYKDIGVADGAAAEEDSIQGQGLLQMATDLNLDPEDLPMLVVLWRLGARTRYEISREEFVDGMTNLGCGDMGQLGGRVDGMMKELDHRAPFKEFYQFVFRYCKPPDQKSMENEMACALWPMLLPEYPHIKMWTEFMSQEYRKAVPRDTWDLFLDFTRETDDTFSNYDPYAAWPVAIDDFVDYAKKKLGL
eukprot:gb/GECH01005471.1/.p1 GENE.gb/GECH01005471.1/~~gb/GECH01005471.1/.p1  ORF type:complete len:262 (+),score=57.06 gb/GECH01005471.1/:1-786(+)